jgi:hypothetical protein
VLRSIMHCSDVCRLKDMLGCRVVLRSPAGADRLLAQLDRLTPAGAAASPRLLVWYHCVGGRELMGMRIWRVALPVMPVKMLLSMSQGCCTPV